MVADYESKTYLEIESGFKSAGFTNVQCIPLQDLSLGIMKKSNVVNSVTIDGQEISDRNKKYSPDVSVVITYHSFR